MTHSSFILHGTAQSPQEPVVLTAGPLTLQFEPDSAFLRRICIGSTEVLRGIYAAVRDRNWGTVSPAINNLQIQNGQDSFEITFNAQCHANEIHFEWKGRITGAVDGAIMYEFDGCALSSFLRNRIGLCVLHPIRECAGAKARFEKTNGEQISRCFPSIIEPQIFGKAGFHDMRRIAHEVRPGLWAEVAFQGDVFEMEDQRNWTDASFKTYCTPLALAFPVEVSAGTRIHQRVELKLVEMPCAEKKAPANLTLNKLDAPSPLSPSVCQCRTSHYGESDADAFVITIPEKPTGSLPLLGVAFAEHGQDLAPNEIERLKLLRLSHLRVDVRLMDNDWMQKLQRADRETQLIGTKLELVVHLPKVDDDIALTEFEKQIQKLQTPISRITALRMGEPATSCKTLSKVRRALDYLRVPIGGGTDAHFCELNREHALGRFCLDDADYLSWPITPQVHAIDSLSLLETIEAQPATLQSARAFAGSRPLVVSPITFKPRFNAVATGEDCSSNSNELPSSVDPRQMSLFGAVWTLATLATLAESGCFASTLYETTGWRGLMERPAGSLLPSAFPSSPGQLYPIYQVFAGLAGFNSFAPVRASLPGIMTGFALFGGVRRRLLLGNLTAKSITVRLANFDAKERLRLRMLDTETYKQAIRDEKYFLTPNLPSAAVNFVLSTFSMRPYAVVVVEC